jgi:hypothetical protein
LTVLTVKVIEAFPAAIFTVAGTDAWDWLLDNEIDKPPVGAMPVKVIVPVEVLPPVTLEGLKLIEVKVGGTIVRTELTDEPFKIAVIVAEP